MKMPGCEPVTREARGVVRVRDDDDECGRTAPAATSDGARPRRAADAHGAPARDGAGEAERGAGSDAHVDDKRGTRVDARTSGQRRRTGKAQTAPTTPRAHLRRGSYLTFLEGFHGQGAVGALALTSGAERFGITWQGGFDLWETATELARERHGFMPVNGDANDVFEQPEILGSADAAALGSPCQKVSWAAWVATQGTARHCDPPDGDHPMNQLYWKQIRPMKRVVKALLVEFLTGVLKVSSASNPDLPPGWLHHKMLAEIEAADEEVQAWTHIVWTLNSNFHGSAALRRRIYTFALHPEVVAAAERAGVAFPTQPAPIPFEARSRLADALIPTEIIDRHHGYLYVDERLEPRDLKYDGTDISQAGKIWTGHPEQEPVSDARLPSLPLKCYNDFPLVMIPDGRVRRLLPTEFLRVGGQAWSVGWGLSGMTVDEGYDKGELERLKTLGGNTWDATLARLTVTALAHYMQPYLDEHANDEADHARVAARFACILNRWRLPARRAIRQWREHVRGGKRAARRLRCAVEEVIVRLRARRIRGTKGRGKAVRIAHADTAIDDASGASGARRDNAGGDEKARQEEAGNALETGPAAGQSRSSSMFLTAGLDAALTRSWGFGRCTHVDERGMPVIRRTHTGKMWGALMACDSEVVGATLVERPEIELRPPPVTRLRREPRCPTAAEQADFRAACPTRESCYEAAGWLKQQRYDDGMQKDAAGIATYGMTGPDAWRVRMVPGTEQGEVRIYKHEYAPAVRGKLVEFDEEDRPRLHVPVPVSARMAPEGSVKIRMAQIRGKMLEMGWPDKEMYFLCDWGHWDKSDARPWVTSLSGNQKAAYENFAGTCAAHELEIKKGWTKRSAKVPFIDMHMCQTNVVPKSNGTMRLLGNPSHPEPGTLLDTVEGELIAPNRATDVELMPGYDWASIEEFAEAVAVTVAVAQMARGWVKGGGDPHALLNKIIVCGSRDDLTKWFRQVPVCSEDWHKQVYNWAGEYLTDGHVQMGRVSSADGAQRLSMVARRILWDEVERELRRRLRENQSPMWDLLRRVVEQRRTVAGAQHTGLWALDLMQDDLAWVAVTEEVGQMIRTMTVTVMEQYGIEVSLDKRAEDEALVEGPQPNPIVLFIGALYDTRDLDDFEAVRMRAQEKTMERLAKVVEEWKQYAPGKLAPRELMQTTLGMCFFHGRFGVRARRRLNSGIRLLRGRNGGHVAVSHEWQRDLASLWAEFQQRKGVTLVRDPVWWHPGLLGCNSDASRPDERASGGTIERGFGGNALHYYFFGAWSDEEVRYLDISTLELIAAGFLLLIAHLSGVTRPRMVMRCDNEAACRVVNDHCADSVAMSEALIWFEATQQYVGVEVLLHHIAGEDNKVADDLSRDAVERAVAALRTMAGVQPVFTEVPPEWRDISMIVRAAKRAARKK